MKKLFFLFTLSLLLVSLAWAQGLETFDNLPETGSRFADGTFLGQDGSTWTYTQIRSDFDVTGNSLMLGRNRDHQANVYSGTIANGIGVLNFNYMQAFSTNVNLNVLVNDVVVGNVTSSSEQEVIKNSGDITVNVPGDFVIKFINANNSDGQVCIDDVSWTGYVTGDNLPPSITDISIDPSSIITSSTDVTVSASITDAEGTVEGASVYWGTTSGTRPNNVSMTNTTGDTWTADIPAQANNTTVYYSIYAIDDEAADNESPEQSYTVLDPTTATIPYSEDFSGGLTGVYTYSVTGTKAWSIYDDAAQCNGYGSTAEEQWLILPGINFDNYSAERMTFNTATAFGAINANNYLKLMYSTSYFGLGDPTTATWEEIPFTNPAIGSGSSSGVLDLSGISGNSVFLAFKYYSTDNPTRWNVDDINIYVATPTIVVTSDLDSFSYSHGSGPSAEQSFVVSGADLTDNILVTAPANYEFSDDTGESFLPVSSMTISHTDGIVDNTTLYVRLKAGLAIGTYNEVLTISSAGADDKTVSLSGDVLTPAAPGAPTSTTATSIGSDSFTANWNAVSGATGYYLDVYTKTIGATSTDLFISEYIEGSSYNKAIEIYNGTGNTVDLTSYSVKLYSGANTSANSTLALSGTLANQDVLIICHASASTAIKAVADIENSSLANFNGDDPVALFNGSTMIDVIGTIGSGTSYGANKTLVRKADATVPSASYSASDWDSYSSDTTTYLGSHTMAGGSSSSYVTGFDNRDVSNVTSYEVTGLDPETEYYYVVRAYDAYAQTSTNSNEIELTTLAASTYDIPDGEATTVGGATVTISGGSANIVPDGVIPAYPNSSITVAGQFVLQLIGAGPWTITIQTDQAWGSYYTGGMWHAVENSGGFITFTVTASKDMDLPVVLANDTTLPVELSSFTAEMNSDNHAVISWVTQTETGVSGYYVLRNSVEDLETALQISALIEAANTSQEHTYSFIDQYIYEPGTYYYWLHVVDIDGTEDYSDPISVVYEYQEPEVPVIPQITEFKNVYPNPFNPNTNISYALSDQQDVTFSIYNSRGQLVRQYDVGSKAAGNYSLVWDGTDYNGRTVTTGVYFIRMQAGRDSFFKKAVLMK